MKPAVLLFASLILAFLGQPLSAQDSQTPDHDGNDVNDSCRTAIDVGEIGYPQPRPVQKTGELARVYGDKYDTRDFYRFGVSANNYNVRFQTNENPPGSMHLRFFNSNCIEFLPPAIGNYYEDVTYLLSPGFYYVVAETLPNRDYNSQYTITLTPTLVPTYDTAGPSCAGAQNLGRLTSQDLTGSLSPTNTTDAYSFYAPKNFQINAFRQTQPRTYEVTVVDRLTNRRFSITDSNLWMQFDPGFYCLLLEQPGLNTTFSYRLAIFTQDIGYASTLDRPQTAGNLAGYSLGNLSSNGYRQDRYVDRYAAPILVRSMQYVIRDWVGLGAAEQWYRFDLPEASTVQVHLSNLLRSARTEIRRADGTLVGATSVTTPSNPFNDRLVSQEYRGNLAPGIYYARTVYLSSSAPGTDYHLTLIADPPSRVPEGAMAKD